jgi:hypothetical protein
VERRPALSVLRLVYTTTSGFKSTRLHQHPSAVSGLRVLAPVFGLLLSRIQPMWLPLNFLQFSMHFTRISKTDILLKIGFYTEAPTKFSILTTIPSEKTSSHQCPPVAAAACRRRCGPRRGKPTVQWCDSTHVGSVGGGFESGGDSGEGVRQRAVAMAAVG